MTCQPNISTCIATTLTGVELLMVLLSTRNYMFSTPAIEIKRRITIQNLLLKISGRTFLFEKLEAIQVAHDGSVSHWQSNYGQLVIFMVLFIAQ
jgi:hypothetical protein